MPSTPFLSLTLPLLLSPCVCLGLHFRLQWTNEEATQCDKRVILRARRQSLHSHSISRRSQQPSGREQEGRWGGRQRGWTFLPPWRHWSGWEEGSEERVGGRDQGVCKEDVSWRLEGLSYRIHLEPTGFPPPPSSDPSTLFCSALLPSNSRLSCFLAELWLHVFLISSVCCRFAEQRKVYVLGNTAADRCQRAPWTVA